MRQLPLGVQLGVSLRFDTFAPGANARSHRSAAAAGRRHSRAAVWIYGPADPAGAICCRPPAPPRVCRVRHAYLPIAQLHGDGPGLLEGFDCLDLVALDDIEAVAGVAGWESAIFTLFNGLAEHAGRLAIAAAGPPASTVIRLPDLASRLAGSEVHRLEPLAEREQPAALRRRAERRGLELPDETLGFLYEARAARLRDALPDAR
jgi:DnaA family protein